MASLASINIKFTADLKGFSTEMQTALRDLSKAGERFKQVGATMSAFITAPLLAAGAASVKFASDYQESINKVDVAFGSSSAGVKQFAKDSLESFGIAEGSALDMAATFGDMGTSLGLPQQKAAEMSKSLVGLAGDLASFKNIGIEQANTALAGIFTGETESLKKLGIVMTEANLQAYALSQGITKQMKDFTQAEKVQLRYAYIMANTTNAQGDFARTGGGAANQMRIFQESMKQLAADFGQVILPAFTKLITYVNGAMKSFAGLSDGTKTTIVAIAGVAAAIGPLLSVMGNLITLVPNLIARIADLQNSVKSLFAVLAANPLTAVVAVLGAVAGYALIAGSRFTALTDSKKEFNEVMASGAESVAKESAELQKNLAVAKNKALSDDQRKKAIENINAISPEMLGNITLENLYTRQTTQAVDAYNESLLKKARVMAAQEKLVEVQKKLLDLQLGQLDAVKPTLGQNLINSLKAAATGGSSFTQQTVAENIKIQKAELEKLVGALTAFISENDSAAASTKAFAGSLLEISKNSNGFLSGTIAFYKQQISAIQKIQEEAVTTPEKFKELASQIEAIQLKIDKLNGTTVDIKKPELPDLDAEGFEGLVIPRTVDFLDAEISRLEKLQTAVSKTSAEYQEFEASINALEFERKEIVIDTKPAVDSFSKLEDEFKSFQEQLSIMVEKLKEDLAYSLGEAIGGLVSGGATLGNVFQSLMGVVADFMKTLGKTLIQIGIAREAFDKLKIGGVAAIAAGIALVALGSIVQSKFADGPAFANGGIVPGNSFVGDKIFARVNSGELILNQQQQQRLWGMMNTGTAIIESETVIEHRISGSDLIVLIRRAEEKKNRIG